MIKLFSDDSLVVNLEEFQSIEDNRNNQNPLVEPKQADVSVNISKVGTFGEAFINGTYNEENYTRAFGVYAVGSYVYVASENAGLVIIDISNLSNLVKVGQSNESNTSFRGVYVLDSYAYMANGWSGGMTIIDISNKTNPVKVGQFDEGGYTENVFVLGSYAYISSGWSLKIIDISNKSNPIKIGSYNKTGSSISDFFISGSYAYLTYNAGDTRSFEIIRISNPSNPIKVGDYLYPSYAYSVQVSGSYAYVAYSEKLFTFDISNPSDPYRVCEIDSRGISDIFISGSYAYVIGSGLRFNDISNPYNTNTIICFNGIGGPQQEIHVSGSYAYIACYDDGLDILHIEIEEIQSEPPIDEGDGEDEENEGDTSNTIASYDLILLLNTTSIVSIKLMYKIRKNNKNARFV